MTNHACTDAQPRYAGIDVAKAKLDVADSHSTAPKTFDNDERGIAALVAHLRQLGCALIVIEATGGYEQPALEALLEADLPVALAHPGQVRHLAKALGIQAKTDVIDARVLVEFARLASPRVAEKRSKNRVELEALITCRRQLITVRTEQGNRLGVTRAASARAAIDAVMVAIQDQIASLDAQIAVLIEDDRDLSAGSKLLRTVPGVGAVVTATLLAELMELGTVGRAQISALAGVAPFACESGAHKGKRAIRGGRTTVRSALYMATITAMRRNTVIQRFAQRLKTAGKPTKVVIVAAMRKLLTLLNAMLRDRLEWSQLNVVQRP